MSFKFLRSAMSQISYICIKFYFLTLVLLYASFTSHAQQLPNKPALIDKNGVLILLRSTLSAVDHANKTGIYTVLRNLGSPKFQIYDEIKLSEIFLNLRRDKIDLSGTAVIDPYLTTQPEILQNGMLHFGGYFPSAPAQVYFDLAYEPVDGQWRLYGVSVAVGSPIPMAGAQSSSDSQKQTATQKK